MVTIMATVHAYNQTQHPLCNLVPPNKHSLSDKANIWIQSPNQNAQHVHSTGRLQGYNNSYMCVHVHVCGLTLFYMMYLWMFVNYGTYGTGRGLEGSRVPAPHKFSYFFEWNADYLGNCLTKECFETACLGTFENQMNRIHNKRNF